MPVITVGIAEVEERLRLVRRRLNSLTVQHALYLSGSLALLAAALVVALALRGHPPVFHLGLWSAAGAVVASGAYAALRIRQGWLSLAQVARLADRRASLDDRLATLIADRARAANSRLRSLLLSQVLAQRMRWEVTAIAPRRAPRSLLLFAASLATFIATTFYARPPAGPEPATPAPQSGRLLTDAEFGLFRPARTESADAAGNPAEAGSPPHTGGGRHGASPARQPTGNEEGGIHLANAGRQPLEKGERPGGARSAAAGDDRSHRRDAQPEETDELQARIRRAFGGADNKAATSARGAEGSEDHPLGAGTSTSERPGESRSARQPSIAKDPPPGEPRLSPDGSGGQPQGGSGAGRDAGGRAPGGLFAKQGATGSAQQADAQPFALRLGSFAASTTTRPEPQRRSKPEVQAAGAPVSPGAPLQLSEEQSPDAPLQKAEVSPEHEELVRRIFTRHE